jgi:hypothetical protein
MRRFTAIRAVCLLAGLIIPAYAAAARDDGKVGQLDPSSTRVAILPVVDRTGDTYGAHKTALKSAAMTALEKQFVTRGFRVCSADEVQDALTRLHLNIEDPEQHRRSVLSEVAKAAKADLVAFCVVTDIRNRDIFGGGLGGDYSYSVTTKSWLVDAAGAHSLLIARIGEGVGTVHDACLSAVNKTFDPVLKPYPRIQAPRQKGSR